ncbi:MAG: TetR/AcrR family transcriptional regulator [Planctomycetes bacterium]|nr:TetR/AcrR family transcriptional regulator [Planctomycetota bacterium]
MARGQTDTKSRILRMTRTLYSTHGCEGTTLDDIITASGITKGAFYHYFKSKDSLCEAVIERVMQDYQLLAESLDGELSPLGQLREMIGKLAKLNASGEWVNCRLILRLSSDSHESHPHIQQKIRKFWQWYFDFFEGLVERCRAAGEISSRLDTKTQVRLLMSVMAGAVSMERISPSKQSFADLAEIVIDTLRS